MNLKKILLTCLLLGTLLLIYPHNAFAMSTNGQSSTEVGIHILEGDYPPSPPEPTPPSPTIHVGKVISTGRLPQTGAVDYYWWCIVGISLLVLIVCIKYFLWLRDKKRGMVNET